MVCHGSLRNSKSPQVVETLLSILAALNNAIVWMVSTYFQVLLSLYQSFGCCIKSTNYNWYKRHFHVPQFFFNPWQGPGTHPFFFRYLLILLCGQPKQQSPQFRKFSFSCWLLQGLVVSAADDEDFGSSLIIPFNFLDDYSNGITFSNENVRYTHKLVLIHTYTHTHTHTHTHTRSFSLHPSIHPSILSLSLSLSISHTHTHTLTKKILS